MALVADTALNHHSLTHSLRLQYFTLAPTCTGASTNSPGHSLLIPPQEFPGLGTKCYSHNHSRRSSIFVNLERPSIRWDVFPSMLLTWIHMVYKNNDDRLLLNASSAQNMAGNLASHAARSREHRVKTGHWLVLVFTEVWPWSPVGQRSMTQWWSPA